MPGTGYLHDALHDSWAQDQQEVPQPLCPHHRTGRCCDVGVVWVCGVVPGTGHLHDALHDPWAQDQQEVPQPLCPHHRTGR